MSGQRASTWILGTRIDCLTIDEAIRLIVGRAADRTSPAVYVVKPYVEFFAADAAVRDVLNTAWLSLADGVALQWAAAYRTRSPSLRWLLSSLTAIVTSPASVTAVIPERVAGATFTWRLLEEARAADLSVALVGTPKRQSIEATAARLRRDLSGLRIVLTAPGHAPDTEPASLAARLSAAGAGLILLGTGFPRQERLIAEVAERLDHGVLIGEGGTFDYRAFGGGIRRAPELIRRAGLEWLWRLGREPRRIVRQVAIPRFIGRVHRQAMREQPPTAR